MQALRARIEALDQELQKKEKSRGEARDALRQSERAISQANRTLASLDVDARALRDEALRIAERRKRLERSLAERQAAIERMLAARAGRAAPEALRVALSGDDPARALRMVHYVGYVSRAAADLLIAYRSSVADLERLAQEAQAKRERLRSLEAAQREQRARVLAERGERRAVLARIAADIRRDRRDINVLRADESRLARLVQALGRSLTRVEKIPERGTPSERFSALRGKLRFPVRGELTGRFGAPRGASGIEAKGVFIRAPEGQAVRAVARGQVVYADWMRGFGNLVIIDHGENYFSVYANTDSVLKQVGEIVGPGDTIATTGASGGSEETGLYFELRHLGRAFDPLKWVKLK